MPASPRAVCRYLSSWEGPYTHEDGVCALCTIGSRDNPATGLDLPVDQAVELGRGIGATDFWSAGGGHARVVAGMEARTIRWYLAAVLSRMRVGYCRFMGVTIGTGCFISSGAHIDVAEGKITIGNHVNIAHGSYILSHAYGRPRKEGEVTVLEDNVTVFVNAVILPGVRIGRDSIVGAGAVVARDVPPGSVVMGNPARTVRSLLSPLSRGVE